MKDEKKSKKQLIEELAEMHQRVAKLEASQTKRKQADKLIRESEERLRTQYQNIPIPTYTWQRAGKDFILVDYNKAGETMTRGIVSNLKGLKASELYNDQPEIIADFSHCFDKRTVIKKEMDYRLKTTGENKHLAVSYAFVPPDLVQVHTEDITSRSQSERDLKQSEQRFRMLVESMRDGLGVQDENGLITYVNERACELSGYSKDELVGRPAADLVDEPFQQRFAEEVSRRREGESSSYEITWIRKDGSKLPAIMSSAPIFDSEGRFRGSFGIITDITQRKRAEEALRESEERHRMLLEGSPDPIVVYDMEGKATYVNPAFEETFGWSSEELLGKRVEFVPEESWPETRAAIAGMLRGERIQSFETRRLTKDGRILDIQLSSSVFHDQDANRIGNIVILRDVTLRKRAEDALRKREAELAEQSRYLEEVNAALNVLLKRREEDKEDLEGRVLANVKELVLPYVEKLKSSSSYSERMTLVGILESNIKEIVSPFASKLSSRFLSLSPTEFQIASLIRDGKTSKEIATLLNASEHTVRSHRFHIRSKLGIKNKKVNMRSYLKSLHNE
jgi:PAS domain S-box-containing protein